MKRVTVSCTKPPLPLPPRRATIRIKSHITVVATATATSRDLIGVLNHFHPHQRGDRKDDRSFVRSEKRGFISLDWMFRSIVRRVFSSSALNVVAVMRLLRNPVSHEEL